MADPKTQIVRYPNRRFYDRKASRYVSLRDIEQIVRTGDNVEILDSQTNDDLTRSVLTRIIMEHQPEKMQLFPIDMLHFILRSNDVMTDFLRDYFRQSLTCLSYLQKHGASASSMAQPMHWVKAWLDGIAPSASDGNEKTESESPNRDSSSDSNRDEMVERIAQLEARLRLLERSGTNHEAT